MLCSLLSQDHKTGPEVYNTATAVRTGTFIFNICRKFRAVNLIIQMTISLECNIRHATADGIDECIKSYVL